MKAPWSGQLSAAKTGWLVMLLFFGWLAYLFVPAPQPESKLTPSPMKRLPSRLSALGLPDNPDLEHLPEFFALYADEAEWKNDKTIFAYWNPSSNSYSYFFEATRQNEHSIFRLIPKSEAYKNMTHKDSVYESKDYLPDEAKITATEPATESATHPIVLFHSYQVITSIYESPRLRRPAISTTRASVPINFNIKPKPLPKIEINKPSIFDEPNKK